MSHKEECICYCIDHLNQRNLAHTFDFSDFNYYYRKFNGAWGNAYSVGMNAADIMIENASAKIKKINDERRNETEAGTTQRA